MLLKEGIPRGGCIDCNKKGQIIVRARLNAPIRFIQNCSCEMAKNVVNKANNFLSFATNHNAKTSGAFYMGIINIFTIT